MTALVSSSLQPLQLQLPGFFKLAAYGRLRFIELLATGCSCSSFVKLSHGYSSYQNSSSSQSRPIEFRRS
ncbi:hypothetical protein NL676_007249 [Syzygium grande]|nr:hypothetical protein NL676_007249 [Syzygium grande]